MQLLYNINIEKLEKINKQYHYNLKLAPRHLHVKNILDFDVIVAPPTGPECINTAGFEYAFMNEYKQYKSNNIKPSHTTFICGSYGAYRTSALLSSILSNKDNIAPFYDHIIDMTYTNESTPESLEQKMISLRNKIVSNVDIEKILTADDFKIAIFVVKLKPIYQYLHQYIQYVIMFFLGLTSIYFPNILQSSLFDRLCFHSKTPPTDVFPEDYIDEYHLLTPNNYKQVLKASSCIPGITTDIDYIEGCGNGIFMDGAISDIHIGFKVNTSSTALILNRNKYLSTNIFIK